MLLRCAPTAFCLLASVVTSSAQPPTPPKPAPELKRLDAFVGKWTAEGQAQASPYGPAAPMTSTDTFEWLPGGFFMAHHWDVKQGATIIKGMEVVGWDAKAKVFTSTFFDNAGNTGVFKGTLQGNAVVWTGETEVAGKPLKERCTMAMPVADAWNGKCEYSSNGTTWMPNFESKNRKAK
jgi:hypothetical protein